METKHTPGPWTPYINGATIAIDFGGKKGLRPNIIHWQGFDSCGLSLVQQKANARLISAAPDLLDCLIHLADKDWFKDGEDGWGGSVSCTLNAAKVRAAIQRATQKP